MESRSLLAKRASHAERGACPSEAVIVDLIEARLDDDASATLHDHIDACAACRALLASLAPPTDPGEDAGLEPPPPVQRTPGMVIGGRYRLDRLLGSGGMGVVWAAMHLMTLRPVALKFVRVLDHARPELRRRALREGQAA